MLGLDRSTGERTPTGTCAPSAECEHETELPDRDLNLKMSAQLRVSTNVVR